MSYIYEALSPGGHQEMLEEVFSKVREQVGSYKTASGSLVSFADGADLPIPSFICNIDAVQDLHGQDAPWVGGAGKNKLPLTIAKLKANNISGTWNGNVYSHRGIDFTITEDNGGNVIEIDVNGTSNADYATLALSNASITQGSYKLNGILNGNQIGLRFDVDGIGSYKTLANGELSLEVSTDTVYSFSIIVRTSGYTENHHKVYPMIRLATETNPTFAPYENICPISGHTGVDAWVRGINLCDEDFETGGVKNNDGTNTSSTTRIRTKNYIRICPNTSYYGYYGDSTIKMYAFYYDENKTYIGAQGVLIDDRVFTTPENAYYMRISTYTNASPEPSTYDGVYHNNISINYPSTDTDYHAYNPNSQTIQVSWQTEAGEVYGGYVDLVSGLLTATHKSQTGFTRGSQDSSNKLYNIGTISDMKAYTTASVISPYFDDSMFEKMSVQGARATENPSIAHYNKALYVGGYIGKEAELDTLLETLQVKYELETPQTYQLTPQQIKSLLGNNNAWCSTGSIKSLQYQPNNIIAELRSEILALQARVEELEQTEQTE